MAPGSHAALILDSAGYHIAAALTIPENITLVRLPPYAPELNPIENVWEYPRGNKLSGKRWRSRFRLSDGARGSKMLYDSL